MSYIKGLYRPGQDFVMRQQDTSFDDPRTYSTKGTWEATMNKFLPTDPSFTLRFMTDIYDNGTKLGSFITEDNSQGISQKLIFKLTVDEIPKTVQVKIWKELEEDHNGIPVDKYMITGYQNQDGVVQTWKERFRVHRGQPVSIWWQFKYHTLRSEDIVFQQDKQDVLQILDEGLPRNFTEWFGKRCFHPKLQAVMKKFEYDDIPDVIKQNSVHFDVMREYWSAYGWTAYFPEGERKVNGRRQMRSIKPYIIVRKGSYWYVLDGQSYNWDAIDNRPDYQINWNVADDLYVPNKPGPFEVQYKPYDDKKDSVTITGFWVSKVTYDEADWRVDIMSSVPTLDIYYETTSNYSDILSLPIMIGTTCSGNKERNNTPFFPEIDVRPTVSLMVGIGNLVKFVTDSAYDRMTRATAYAVEYSSVAIRANVYINGKSMGVLPGEVSGSTFYFTLPAQYYNNKDIRFGKWPYSQYED